MRPEAAAVVRGLRVVGLRPEAERTMSLLVRPEAAAVVRGLRVVGLRPEAERTRSAMSA